MHSFNGDLIYKGITARRLYKSFGVKRLTVEYNKKLIDCTAKIYYLQYNFRPNLTRASARVARRCRVVIVEGMY
jgi:hypothetical protein